MRGSSSRVRSLYVRALRLKPLRIQDWCSPGRWWRARRTRRPVQWQRGTRAWTCKLVWWRPRDAHASHLHILRQLTWAPSRRGPYTVRTSRTPSPARMALNVMYFRAHQRNGILAALTVLEITTPDYELNDAPVAFHLTSHSNSLRTEESSAKVGQKIQVSSFDQRLSFIFRGSGGATGALTAHSNDGLGCGETGILLKRASFRCTVLGA